MLLLLLLMMVMMMAMENERRRAGSRFNVRMWLESRTGTSTSSGSKTGLVFVIPRSTHSCGRSFHCCCRSSSSGYCLG
uniref:Putative secreted protein n=1 Tax=Anopheles darlingi TaxID=43151 RepID=A0A2M4DI66_ANODA